MMLQSLFSPVFLPRAGPIADSNTTPVARQKTTTNRASGKPNPGAWDRL
jgi:hypothetical protein